MDYDLRYFDLEMRVLEPLENPFGPKVLPMSSVRSVTHVPGLDRDKVVGPSRRFSNLDSVLSVSPVVERGRVM